MLRAGELTKIVDKAELALALTDSRIADELVAALHPEMDRTLRTTSGTDRPAVVLVVGDIGDCPR